MAVNPKLEAFLAANEPETPPTEAPEPAAPAPEPAASVKSKPAAAPSEAPQEADDEADDGDQPSVPRKALIEERKQRQNWVERASKAEALAEERRQEIERFRKQQEAAAQPQQQYQNQGFQFPDPQVDPVGFAIAHATNNRFNTSQMLARKEHGKEAVDKLVAEFAEVAQRDPSLWQRIRQEEDPFDWAFREMERQRLLREVGDDPKSYEQKLREKWEAERAAQLPAGIAAPTNTPPPRLMPPSLAGVRSVAGRAAPVWSGPLSDQQIAEQNRAHRMAQRNR